MRKITVNDQSFINFFVERFKKSPILNNHDHGYADEWVDRFNRGTQFGNKNTTAWNVADSETQDAIRKHMPEWAGVSQ